MSTDQSKEVENSSEVKTEEPPIIKKLNGSSTHPPKERIGIYTIAILSAIGILLIVYSGVMAVAHSGFLNDADSGLDVEDIDNILDDLDLGDDEDETYPEEPTIATEEATEPTEVTEPEAEEAEGIPGIITEDHVVFRREAAGSEILGHLHTNTEVIILDNTSNPFWTHISVDGQEGFVESNRLEPVSD